MARDESRDCYVLFRFGKPLRCYQADVKAIESHCGSDEAWLMSPHSQLVDLERQLADREFENAELRKRLGECQFEARTVEINRSRYALPVVPTENRGIADTGDIEECCVVCGCAVDGGHTPDKCFGHALVSTDQLCDALGKAEDLERQLADRDAETAKLRKRIAELEDELRMANHKEDTDRDYTDETFARFC